MKSAWWKLLLRELPAWRRSAPAVNLLDLVAPFSSSGAFAPLFHSFLFGLTDFTDHHHMDTVVL